MNIQDKRVLTFNEGCELLGYKKSYVYQLVKEGKLPFSKPPNGRRIFFERTKLEAWLLGSPVNDEAKKEDVQTMLFDVAMKAVKLNSLSVSEPSKQLSNG